MSARGEFGFIDFIRQHFSVPKGITGIGDDCAILPQSDCDGLFSTDLLMEGVHFLRQESSPEDVGWKAAAVNLSDIAAMGGMPVCTFLSLALPKEAQGEWAERFIKGYAEISRLYEVPLLGGDTTSSLRDIAVNVGVLGKCASGRALTRNQAQVGDVLYVTGTLGDSAGGLQAILQNIRRTPDVEVLIRRHLRPIPHVREGQALLQSGEVNAMMDVSDGIASDLRHILKASGVGAQVELSALPLSEELTRVAKACGWNPYELAVSGGEDFCLLLSGTEGMDRRFDFPLYPIGRITEGNALVWTLQHEPQDLPYTGYQHF